MRRPSPLVLLTLAAALAAPTAFSAEIVDGIVLRVNGEILTHVEYEKRREDFVTAVLANPNLTAEDRQDRLSKIGKVIVWDAYREMLLLSRAEQMSIDVDDEQIDASILEIREKQGIQTDEQMEQALAASNMTLEQLRKKMRTEILWSQVVGEEVSRNIEIPDEELRAHYRAHEDEFTIEEKRLVQEFIVLESGTPDEAERRRLAAEGREQAIAGGDLGAAALPDGAATSVIELGWLTRDDLDPALAESVFAAEAGAITEPVEGRGGLHVLQVLEVEEGRVRAFTEVENEILARERNKRFDQELREYLADLESKAWVVEKLPPDAVGYRELAGTLETTTGALDIFSDPNAAVSEDRPERPKRPEPEAADATQGE